MPLCIKWSFVLLSVLLFFIAILLNPTPIYAQSACSSLTGCTIFDVKYNIAYPDLDGCTFDRTFYICSGTTCYQDGNVSCSQTQAICNNPPSTGDNYNCTKFCTDLSVSPNCGNYPGVDCTTFKNTCLNSYCVAAGGGTSYTCPSPQECVSSGDKAHQCITPVLPACTCPAASDVACGTTLNTPTNSPCTGTCSYVAGTSSSFCSAGKVCSNGVCTESCPIGPAQGGITYSCEVGLSCPAGASPTYYKSGLYSCSTGNTGETTISIYNLI